MDEFYSNTKHVGVNCGGQISVMINELQVRFEPLQPILLGRKVEIPGKLVRYPDLWLEKNLEGALVRHRCLFRDEFIALPAAGIADPGFAKTFKAEGHQSHNIDSIPDQLVQHSSGLFRAVTLRSFRR